jgi:ElaB/YqjD/DUF883 family membrane-anchored ribosome-binding protein
MAEATSQFENQGNAMQAEMTETRTALADKVESLEQGLMDSWQSATESVNETIDSVKATVETTVQAVQGVVQDTTHAIGHAFDLAAHCRKHPWLTMGGAVVAGFAIGFFLVRPRR